MGTSDLTKDLHARHTPDRHPLVTSLGLCVLAARAHGRAALDGVHLDLDDETGFAAACRQAREMGFDGKTLIHPKTIAVANEIFAPSPDEIARARRIMVAHAEAATQGRGVVVVDGQLVENLHVEEAARLVALADALAD
jgi:citrate lyase subunit beta/citryl-CoA lyase